MHQTAQPILYKVATPADLGEIAALFRAATAEMNARLIPQWDDLYPNEAVLSDDIARGEMTLGRIGSTIAVVYAVSTRCDAEYADGHWQDASGAHRILHRLCVHPAFQNRGVARDTMDRIEQTLRAAGVSSIRLDAFSQNPYALRLYESRGYRFTGAVRFRKGLFYLYEKLL